MPTVLLSAPYMIPVLDRFRPVFQRYALDLIVPEVHERLSEEEILQYAGQFDAAVCGDDRYSERVLAACAPRLKVVSKWGTGIDSIDRTAAARLGIQVCNTPNAFSIPVADTVFGYLLVFARRLLDLDRVVKAGNWQKLPGRALAECTLGVVGIGNVGRAVVQRGRAFGLRLLGNDIVPIDPQFVANNSLEMTSLKDLLSRADFISLHCDLNPTSYHLINRRTLGLVQPQAVLINTARGPVVEEPALIEALQTGRLAGAALDVFEVEPLPEGSPLAAMDNVLLAPHNANSSPTAWERVHQNTLTNLLVGLGIANPDVST